MIDMNNCEKTRLFGLIRSLGLDPDFNRDEVIHGMMEGKRPIHGIPSLNEVEILDSFISYLTEVEVLSSLKKAQVLGYRRVMVPMELLLLTYMTKLLLGVPSMNALPKILFSNHQLMDTIGFTSTPLTKGICRRGSHGRKSKETPKPFSPQMLSNFIERFSEEEAELLFNTVIRNLAQFGSFPQEITVLFDHVDLITSIRYQGCGKRIVTQKEIKDNSLVEIEKMEYGFKVSALLDLKTGIPLAVKFLGIKEDETDSLAILLRMAAENTGQHAKIAHLSCNRSTPSPQSLDQLNSLGILFYSAVEKDTMIYQEALELAEKGRGIEQNISESNGIITLTGLENLHVPETHLHNFNAVVITGTHKEYCQERGNIFLTNSKVKEPLIPFKKYHQASILKSLLHKKDRQGWHLQKPPKKNKRTMINHMFLTMLTFGLTRAYRGYQKKYYQGRPL